MLVRDMKHLNKQKISPSAVVGASQSGNVLRITSAELLAGQRELVIEHGAEEYRLRITSKGKLILTK
ncbi:hypothetical protein MNBD_GAMMA16-1198 [hydrothermal vent metagenome]|uniref:Hemin uptake protein HemP n=1 Tax=hydrothermal vent metagenome TaxID=652676 RepID=A0A3B0Z678_9ZZZZ